MRILYTGCIFMLVSMALPVLAQNVRITPLGSHPGELCANDRALVFEDPTGIRLLYDPAHNLTAGDDPRLGDIHVVLLSHMHGDHLGDRRLQAVGAGTCANSARVSTAHSMTSEVVIEKNAVLVTTRAMAGFIASEVQDVAERALTVCNQPVAATVPVENACSARIDLGGVFTAKTSEAMQGVEITIVYASHVNNAPPALLSEERRAAAEADGAVFEYGPATGFVVKFSNGLVVYLSGDTGINSEMKTVINEFHQANLAVLNLGNNTGIYLSAPYVVNELLQPEAVILTHVNEAATEEGQLRSQSRTYDVVQELEPPAYLAISERTMLFDGEGRCVEGCD
jgi:L-ascorbate metabolism protein UlaG (beta-lactamase superfamily)